MSNTDGDSRSPGIISPGETAAVDQAVGQFSDTLNSPDNFSQLGGAFGKVVGDTAAALSGWGEGIGEEIGRVGDDTFGGGIPGEIGEAAASIFGEGVEGLVQAGSTLGAAAGVAAGAAVEGLGAGLGAFADAGAGLRQGDIGGAAGQITDGVGAVASAGVDVATGLLGGGVGAVGNLAEGAGAMVREGVEGGIEIGQAALEPSVALISSQLIQSLPGEGFGMSIAVDTTADATSTAPPETATDKDDGGAGGGAAPPAGNTDLGMPGDGGGTQPGDTITNTCEVPEEDVEEDG